MSASTSFEEEEITTTSTTATEKVKEPNPLLPQIELLVACVRDSSTEDDVVQTLQSLGDLAREDANRETIAEVGGIDAVIEALKKWKENPLVEHKALRVFANLSFYNNDNALAICDVEKHSLSVIKLSIDHTSRFESNPDFSRLACAAMTNLCHEDDGVREQICEAGGVEVLAAMLRKFLLNFKTIDPADLRGNALRAFDNLSESEKALQTFMSAGVFDLLVEYLQEIDSRESDSFLDLSKTAIKILETIAVSKLYHTEAVNRNVVGVLTSLLYFALDHDVEDEYELEEVNEFITQIIASLQNMIKCDLANFANQFFDGEEGVNTIQALIKLISREQSTNEIKEAVVELLGSVSEKDSLQQPLLQEGILEPIILISDRVTKQKETVKIHHSKLLRFAIKILSFLALDNNNLESLIEKGAGQIIVDSLLALYEIQEGFGPEDMGTFQQMNTFVLRNTCIGLGNLARTDDNCAALVRIGAVRALLNFLSKGADQSKVDMNLICNAAFALTNLTKADGCKEAIVAEGAIDVLNTFLDPEVPYAMQFYAADAIANLIKNKPQHVAIVTAGANEGESIVDRLVTSLRTLQTQPKLVYAVMKAFVAFVDEDPAVRDLIVNKLDTELVQLVSAMQQNEDKKIRDMSVEAINKLRLSE